MENVSPKQSSRYFVPAPSTWPFVTIVGLVLCILAFGHWLEGASPIPYIYPLVIGLALFFFTVIQWFHGVSRESEDGHYNPQVDRTYRWGMAWFIFSEVCFFGAFFFSLFYTHVLSVPWLAGAGAKFFTGAVLWPHFTGAWPSNGPGALGGAFTPMEAWGLPAINTLVLITSSFTVTWAHHALKENNRARCVAFMVVTVVLGLAFLFLQAHEYIGAYTEQNLTLGSGVYGSTFFVMTGFHGLHVTVGTIMLIVITGRLLFGHFKPDSHFGFEGVAWYWHFVDVVWILLFTFVYVL